jgi:tRNA pseudouridine(55) synthase
MFKNQVLKLNKKIGETPLECIKRFKADNPEYENEKMTYAGRLDPLAEGLLLVLVGEECKKKNDYLKLDKEYEVTILFGIETDSLDVLGLVEKAKPGALDFFAKYTQGDFRTLLEKFEKTFTQKYPKFSSRTIAGRPLFQISKEEGIAEKDLPEREVSIHQIDFLGFGFLSKKYLHDYALENIYKVKGNFRQNMAWCSWAQTLEKYPDDNLPTITIKVRCSSGTYMRKLAQNIGIMVNYPAIALLIKRTMIYL